MTDKGINILLNKYGASIKDGFLTLESNANIPKLVTEITRIANAKGTLLASEMAELADALDQYFSNITNLLRNGIKGTLSNVDAQGL